jgi:hypothetical protein
MANEIRTKRDADAAFTITLASLATSAVGVGRQSTTVTNTNKRPAMLLEMILKSGGVAPTAGSVALLYLLRVNAAATYTTDGCAAADAAITIENAQLIGTIIFTATTNKLFYGDFDTAPLGPLDEKFGIAVVNSTGQTWNATEASFTKSYALYLPEIQ